MKTAVLKGTLNLSVMGHPIICGWVGQKTDAAKSDFMDAKCAVA